MLCAKKIFEIQIAWITVVVATVAHNLPHISAPLNYNNCLLIQSRCLPSHRNTPGSRTRAAAAAPPSWRSPGTPPRSCPGHIWWSHNDDHIITRSHVMTSPDLTWCSRRGSPAQCRSQCISTRSRCPSNIWAEILNVTHRSSWHEVSVWIYCQQIRSPVTCEDLRIQAARDNCSRRIWKVLFKFWFIRV